MTELPSIASPYSFQKYGVSRLIKYQFPLYSLRVWKIYNNILPVVPAEFLSVEFKETDTGETEDRRRSEEDGRKEARKKMPCQRPVLWWLETRKVVPMQTSQACRLQDATRSSLQSLASIQSGSHGPPPRRHFASGPLTRSSPAPRHGKNFLSHPSLILTFSVSVCLSLAHESLHSTSMNVMS